MSAGRPRAAVHTPTQMSASMIRRAVGVAALRSLGVLTVTLGVYALVPIRPETAWAVGLLALAGLAVVVVVFVRQLPRVSRSASPLIAVVESLTLIFGMFLSLFSFIYVSLSADDPGAFTQPVDKIAGIYYSVTILATVGFGDIAAVSDLARIIVTVQMVLDLVLIGTAVKLLTMSARQGVEARLAGLAEQAEAAQLAGPVQSSAEPAPGAGDPRDA